LVSAQFLPARLCRGLVLGGCFFTGRRRSQSGAGRGGFSRRRNGGLIIRKSVEHYSATAEEDCGATADEDQTLEKHGFTSPLRCVVRANCV
jgi:hypothetical protein